MRDRLVTARLTLVPASASLIRNEMRGPRFLGEALGVQVHDGWPPPDLAEVLPFFHRQLLESPRLAGWFPWYWVLIPNEAGRSASEAGLAELVGAGGFTGPPEDGRVEIGYHVQAEHRRRGYAAEAVQALLKWAFGHPEVEEVIAEAAADNDASIGLLEKLGFARVGAGSQPGLIRFAAGADRWDLNASCVAADTGRDGRTR
jgi:RimJ/RimL family protein N-acetyltransferase